MRGIPNSPANRSPKSDIAITDETTKTRRERLAHEDCHPPPCDRFRYQPLASMTTVSTRNGQLSTRNAGAMASPADVPPIRPSRPGITHHQGKGKSPLNSATNGLSICSHFNIGSPLLFPSGDKPSERDNAPDGLYDHYRPGPHQSAVEGCRGAPAGECEHKPSGTRFQPI